MDDGQLVHEKALFAKNKWDKANHSSSGCYALNKPGKHPLLVGTKTPPRDNIPEGYAFPAIPCHSIFLKSISIKVQSSRKRFALKVYAD